ncbi:MAG: hypothetical protein AAGA48_24815 [Myxococcota bacterium]
MALKTADEVLARLELGEGDEVSIEPSAHGEAILVLKVRSIALANQVQDDPGFTRRDVRLAEPGLPLDHVEVVRRVRWTSEAG